MVGVSASSTIAHLGTYILTIVQPFIVLPPATLLLVRQNYTLRVMNGTTPNHES